MKYRIISLKYTSKMEDCFNFEYHKKYIGRIGDCVSHNYRSGNFIDAILLYTDYDPHGKPIDGNWFHKNDLELI